MESVSVFRWNLLSWAQLIPISGHLHQHKMGYTNQAQHKSSARVKTKIRIIKNLHMHEALHQITVSIDVINRETNSLYSTNIKIQLSYLICTERSCSFLTSAAIMGVQMGEMSKLG
jgi:hypothetical protein